MGDAWETSHGLNPASAADAGLDQDGDGRTNWEEWISGTLPDDPNSWFVITREEKAPAGGIEISWTPWPESVTGSSHAQTSLQDPGPT